MWIQKIWIFWTPPLWICACILFWNPTTTKNKSNIFWRVNNDDNINELKKTLNFFSNCKENFYVLYEIDCKKSIKKSTPYQARTIVSLDIFFTYGHKTPESLLCRHMHQQYSSYRGHGLAVAISWVVNGVGLQNFVQVFLTIKYHREQILG